MHKGERIALVIPALNEEKSVGEVVRSFLDLRDEAGAPIIDVVLVGDNDSRDRTASEAEAAGARVVHEMRRGYGSACLAAIAALPSDISVIVFADADSSDDPSELPRLLDALDAGADLVIGSRALGKPEPGALTAQQIFGNRLSALLIRMIWRHPITDLGPYRVIRRTAYDRLGMADRDYGWTVEMQVKAIQCGLKVVEVPVSYRRRIGVSKISGTVRGTIGAGTKILGMIAWLRLTQNRSSGRCGKPAVLLLLLAALAFAFGTRSNNHENALLLPALNGWMTTESLKGIALGMHFGDSCDYRPAIDEIAATGAQAVELVIPYSQRTARSSDPGAKPGSTPSLETLRGLIRHAKARRLQVYLLPIVLLDHADTKEWRGVMKPDDPDAWWSHYGDLLGDLARLAESEQVRALSVGSELIWSERMRERWLPLIQSVRRNYSGKLLYSANWDHYRPVAFWDLLDEVGISGYYELTRDSEASVDDLRGSWQRIRGEILDWRKDICKPLLFTEIGYPAVDGGAVHPWNYTIKGRRDDEEQERALAAFFEAWQGTPELAGAFIYEWGVAERGGSLYSPRGRSAEQLVRYWMSLTRKEGTEDDEQ